jgi:hypothetical protein
MKLVEESTSSSASALWSQQNFTNFKALDTEMSDCLRDFPPPQLLCSHCENERAKSLSVEQLGTFEPFPFATFGAAEMTKVSTATFGFSSK